MLFPRSARLQHFYRPPSSRLIHSHALTTEDLLLRCARLWGTGLPATLGLAVSGGVDSMALAHLLRPLSSQRQIYTFTIDHGARAGSSTEARSVAAMLSSWGFAATVIPLHWAQHQHQQALPSAFETAARVARYQALGQACVDHGVRHLLLAHHADDNAETVLMRLATEGGGRVRIEGLAGMRACAELPVDVPVFGARGLRLYRPLLDVPKSRLVATCERAGVRWFEDATNQDATYTQRNAVRALLTTSPSSSSRSPLLPRALQTPSLLSLAARASTRAAATRAHAHELLTSIYRPTFSARTGILRLTLPQHADFASLPPAEQAAHAAALAAIAQALRFAPATPRRAMPLAATLLAPTTSPRATTAFALLWTHRADGDGDGHWDVCRAPPPATQVPALTIHVDVPPTGAWTPWMLFDRRWWARFRCDSGSGGEVVGLAVRFLTPEDMVVVRALAEKAERRRQLREVLRNVPRSARFALPVMARYDGDEGDGRGRIVGVPWLHDRGVGADGSIQWQFVYKESALLERWADNKAESAKVRR